MNVTYATQQRERQLSGLSCLVTGADSGIGRATAIALAEHGMRVILVGRRESMLHETAAEMTHSKGQAITRPCDLADPAAVTRLAQSVVEELSGQLAILVHSAEMHSAGSIEHTSGGQFDNVFRTNVHAPFQLTQLLLPALREARGDIVFVSSAAAFNSAPNAAPYAASKAALRSLSDTLRHEVGPAGVRVLNVYPGSVAGPMHEALPFSDNLESVPEPVMQPADVAHVIVRALSFTTAELTELHVRPLHKAASSDFGKSLGWD